MATLHDLVTGRRHLLGFRQVIGRSPTADIVCAASHVSGSHLLIRFDGAAWLARDLGSRNGTRLSGESLSPGEDIPLIAGSELVLGEQATRFHLLDTAPPRPRARRVDGPTEQDLTAEDGLIVFGREPAIHAMLFRGREGVWTLDEDGVERPVEPGEVVVIDGVAWRLDLPDPDGETLAVAAPSAAASSSPVLAFRVSSDEEYIETTVIHGETRESLGPRAFGELLLYLARERASDAAEPDLPESDHGWRYTDEVQRQLARSRTQINLDVYRARQALAALDLPDATEVVQRRTSTSQIRLGFAGSRIVPA